VRGGDEGIAYFQIQRTNGSVHFPNDQVGAGWRRGQRQEQDRHRNFDGKRIWPSSNVKDTVGVENHREKRHRQRTTWALAHAARSWELTDGQQARTGLGARSTGNFMEELDATTAATARHSRLSGESISSLNICSFLYFEDGPVKVSFHRP
jgi:hypothetical protein